MYNNATLKTELLGLVGWRQNIDDTGPQLLGLTTSSSGLYFNDMHPVLTFDNLLSIAPKFDAIDPGEVSEMFTDWLTEKTEAGILKAISAWLGRKVKNRTAKNLLNDAQLFRTTGHVQDLDTDNSKIVGIEITPRRHKGIVTRIRRVALQLSANQSLTVNLYHSGSMSVIGTPLTANYTAGGGVQWFAVSDWTLEPSGTYWIEYDQRDLVGQSINGLRDYNYDNAGIAYYPGDKFYQSVAFANVGTDASLWDISKNEHSLSTNYGLNIELDVRCDYTDLVVDQKDLFPRLVALQVAMDFVREMAHNSSARVNRNESAMDRAQLLYEIDGDSQGRADFSLLGQFEDELDNIAFDDSMISRDCLPCRRRSATLKTIGPR